MMTPKQIEKFKRKYRAAIIGTVKDRPFSVAFAVKQDRRPLKPNPPPALPVKKETKPRRSNRLIKFR